MRAKLASDPFLRAQLEVAFLYFIFCCVTLAIVGAVVDAETRDILMRSIADSEGFPMEEALRQIEIARYSARAFYVLTFAFGAFALIGLSLKPIKQATERQRHFVANLSHELRTPLAAAKTELDVALRKKDRLTLPEALVLLEKSRGDIEHVARVLQFLTVLSDFQMEKERFATAPLNLRQIIEEVHKHYSEQAQAKGIRLVVEHQISLQLNGNPIAIEKLIANLVRNALAHTPSGGEIRIGVRKNGSLTCVYVSDTGNGIDPSDIPHLSEPFYRGKGVNHEGSGLGLSISWEIAKLHNARIEVKSEVGKGSTFEVYFPEPAKIISTA